MKRAGFLGPPSALLVTLLVARCCTSAAVAQSGGASSFAPAEIVDIARPHGLVLPSAEHTLSGWAEDAPNILLEGQQLSVDGVVAGSVDQVVKLEPCAPLKALAAVLAARRAAWKVAHPRAEGPYMALLWLDAATPVLVAKSVFQTAAFAGYPDLSFAVRRKQGDPNAVERIAVDAVVPPLPDSLLSGVGDPFTLHVTALVENNLTLSWQAGGEVLATIPVAERADVESTAFPGLALKIGEEWHAHGGHPLVEDLRLDMAELHVSNAFKVQALVALMDAIYVPMRAVVYEGRLEKIPAFNLALGVN